MAKICLQIFLAVSTVQFLRALGGQRPRMLLHVGRRTGQPIPQRVIQPQTPPVLELRKPDLKRDLFWKTEKQHFC